jgi:uncharacterized membrane-anchored protein YitT (DUF2179 family)
MSNKVKKNFKSEILAFVVIFLTSILVALGLHVFVYKADFAPSGIDGLATMLQYASERIFGYRINAGIFTFILNLPLLIAAWFILNKRYVFYTILYTIVVSVSIMLFDVLGVPQYDCTILGTNNSHVVAAIFGGVAQGLTGLILRLGGSSGGVDILGCIIQKKIPHKDVEKIIAILSYIVVAIAFFVYGNINSVCLSVIEIFVCEKVTSAILKSNRSAIKFEIVTEKKYAEEIKRLIIFNLHHGATIITGQGAFSEQEKEVIVCVVSYRQLPEFLKLVKSVPNTFLYYSDVMGVRGNFDWSREDERPEDTRLFIERMEKEKQEIKNK